MSNKVIILIILAHLALIGAAVAVYAYATKPPVPDAKRLAVKSGMPEEAVRELLGPPTKIHLYSNDIALGVTGTNWAAQWTYNRDLPWKSTWVYVMFTNGSVSRVGGNSFP